MVIRIFIFGLLLLSCISGFGQSEFNISGKITDDENENLIGALVTLNSESDSFVARTSADIEGEFEMTNVAPGRYKLIISYLGFADFITSLSVTSSNIDLGHIKISDKESKELEEVKIVGQAVMVQQKGDTTQFNAGSFKVNPDATTEDLLRKMPGMDLSSGSPKSQGEQVSKVLVDGKPFFGEDPTSALRNLPAEVVDKIQVYDERSDQSQFTGFDDGNTSKTINIITRQDRRKGVFGRVYGGYGWEDKYNVGGNINYFEGKRRISLVGHSNNINIQNFNSEDLVGVSGGSGNRMFGRGGGGRGRGGGRGGSQGGNDGFMVNQQGGISRTNSIGVNYSDSWGEKIEVTGSYFFNNSHNVSDQYIHRDYVLASQSGQTYDESNHSVTDNFNHRFNLRMNYTIDSFNSILFVPRFSAQVNEGNSNLSANTLLNQDQRLNSTLNNFITNLSGYNASSMLLYRHKFKKEGRTVSLMADGGYNQNTGNSKLFAQNTYIDVLLNDTLDQESNLNRTGWNINSNITYTEPISKKNALQFRYRVNLQKSESDKRTNHYDLFTQDYTIPDTLLSNTFKTNYLTQSGGLSLRHSDSNINVNIGLEVQSARLYNDRVLPNAYELTRNFSNILPNAMLQYRFTNKKNIRLFYRTSTSAPSVDQLQDVVDNSNPLQLSSGNANLNQSYRHNLFLRYSATNSNVSSSFFAMLRAAFTNDYIGNSTTIAEEDMVLNGNISLPKGAQYTVPVNMNGHADLGAFTTYGLPITAIKSNFNMNAQVGYTRIPGLINEQRNISSNTNLGLGIVLSSNISENIDFTISSNSSYNIVNNTLNKTADNTFFNQSSRLSLNYIFWKGIVINTDLNHQYYTGMSEGFNSNFLLWNAGIGKKLFKKQQAEIRLNIFDIMGQNMSLERTITEAYAQDLRTNVLQRYFMLTFTYNLRYFKGGASINDVGDSNRNMERPTFHPMH